MVAASDDQKPDIDRLIDSVGNPYCPVCCDPECPVTTESHDPDGDCANGESDSLASAKELFFSDDTQDFINAIKHGKENPTNPPSDDHGSSTALYTEPDEYWDPGTDHSWNEDPNAWWDYQADDYYAYDQPPHSDVLYSDYAYDQSGASYRESE